MSTQFTPGARAGILARLELGVSFTDSATAAGVKVSTAKGWLARGRQDPDGAYGEFAQAVEVARETGKATEPGDAAELRRRVWTMVESGSVEAAKLYHRILTEADGLPPGSVDPWKSLGIPRGTG